jgi:hypothetical protein
MTKKVSDYARIYLVCDIFLYEKGWEKEKNLK